MRKHAVSSWLLSVAALLVTQAHLRADPPPAAANGQRFELFSSVTGSWAKVNELDPLKPMAGDKLVVAVSASESFVIVLSRVEEAPRGLSISWTGSVAGEPGSHFAVGFTRPAGDPK